METIAFMLREFRKNGYVVSMIDQFVILLKVVQNVPYCRHGTTTVKSFLPILNASLCQFGVMEGLVEAMGKLGFGIS